MVLHNAEAMGVLSQSELCPRPILEKDRLEEVPQCSQSPEKEASPTQSSVEGDLQSPERGTSPGDNLSDGAEDDEASSTESAQAGVSCSVSPSPVHRGEDSDWE